MPEACSWQRQVPCTHRPAFEQRFMQRSTVCSGGVPQSGPEWPGRQMHSGGALLDAPNRSGAVQMPWPLQRRRARETAASLCSRATSAGSYVTCSSGQLMPLGVPRHGGFRPCRVKPADRFVLGSAGIFSMQSLRAAAWTSSHCSRQEHVTGNCSSDFTPVCQEHGFRLRSKPHSVAHAGTTARSHAAPVRCGGQDVPAAELTEPSRLRRARCGAAATAATGLCSCTPVGPLPTNRAGCLDACNTEIAGLKSRDSSRTARSSSTSSRATARVDRAERGGAAVDSGDQVCRTLWPCAADMAILRAHGLRA